MCNAHGACLTLLERDKSLCATTPAFDPANITGETDAGQQQQQQLFTISNADEVGGWARIIGCDGRPLIASWIHHPIPCAYPILPPDCCTVTKRNPFPYKLLFGRFFFPSQKLSLRWTILVCIDLAQRSCWPKRNTRTWRRHFDKWQFYIHSSWGHNGQQPPSEKFIRGDGWGDKKGLKRVNSAKLLGWP